MGTCTPSHSHALRATAVDAYTNFFSNMVVRQEGCRPCARTGSVARMCHPPCALCDCRVASTSCGLVLPLAQPSLSDDDVYTVELELGFMLRPRTDAELLMAVRCVLQGVLR